MKYEVWVEFLNESKAYNLQKFVPLIKYYKQNLKDNKSIDVTFQY